MEVTRITTVESSRLRSGSARACHSGAPTPTRSPLMSRKSTSLQVAQVALHRTHIIFGSGEGPATSIFDITWHSAIFMSCLSAKAAIILLLAPSHTFSVGGASAARVVFEADGHLLC